jgi:integrase
MAISRRNNSWQVDVTCNGKRVRRSFQSLIDAQKYELEVRIDLMEGRSPKKAKEIRDPVSVGGMGYRVYDLIWSQQKSADHTFNRLVNVVDYFGEETLIKDITTSDLEKYALDLRLQGNSPATINRKGAIISKILGHAKKHGIISTKPVFPNQKEPIARNEYYTKEQEKEIIGLIQTTDDEEFEDFFTVLIDTGMRRGEAASLTWDCVDFDESVIHLKDPDKIKTGLVRSIPMTSRVKRIFKKLKSNKELETPFNLSTIYWDSKVDRFKRMTNRNFPRMLHTCRHTFCSRLVQGGVPINEVKELAGHKDLRTTLGYAHLAPSNLKSAIKVLELK